MRHYEIGEKGGQSTLKNRGSAKKSGSQVPGWHIGESRGGRRTVKPGEGVNSILLLQGKGAIRIEPVGEREKRNRELAKRLRGDSEEDRSKSQ